MIKVAHINYADLDGGASRASYRLHQALIKNNIDSQMYVLRKKSNDQKIFSPSGKWNQLLIKIARKKEENKNNAYPNKFPSHFSALAPNFGLINKIIKKRKPDLLHLHWINRGTFSIQELKKIEIPIVWTLHDMWAFTGGCHYSSGCQKYQIKCEECPILNSKSENDLSRKTWDEKHHVYQQKNISVVTPSQWLSDCAKNSALMNQMPIKVIPNAIDTEAFSPLPTADVRKKWNIPENKFILLFGATAADKDIRKGYEALRQALSKIKNKNNYYAIVFGTNQKEQASIEEIPTLFTGHITEDIELQELYSAADVTILPSLEENLSNIILESMSCGTPVIAFNIGGYPDAILNNKNGSLTNSITPIGLRKCIEDFFEQYTNLDFKTNCKQEARQTALSKFDSNVVANQYIKIYQSLL